MASLSGHSITRTLVLASLATPNPNNNNNTTSSFSQSNTDNSHIKPPISIPKSKTQTQTTSSTLPRNRKLMKMQRKKLQQQLNLIHIERAIGAGSYRDSEPPNKDSEQTDSIFNGILPNSGGALEGTVEQKLRETGEWLANETETKFRSSGKRILMFTYKWVLPIYIFLFMVASGVIKLPFSTTLLDDLIM